MSFYRQAQISFIATFRFPLMGEEMMPLVRIGYIQGTIPLCSDVSILRYSSSPFAEFVFSEELGYNALQKMIYWNNYDALNFDLVVKDWVERIDFLYDNIEYVETYI